MEFQAGVSCTWNKQFMHVTVGPVSQLWDGLWEVSLVQGPLWHHCGRPQDCTAGWGGSCVKVGENWTLKEYEECQQGKSQYSWGVFLPLYNSSLCQNPYPLGQDSGPGHINLSWIAPCKVCSLASTMMPWNSKSSISNLLKKPQRVMVWAFFMYIEQLNSFVALFPSLYHYPCRTQAMSTFHKAELANLLLQMCPSKSLPLPMYNSSYEYLSQGWTSKPSPTDVPWQLAKPVFRRPFCRIPAGSSLFLSKLRRLMSHLQWHRNLLPTVM